MVHDEVRCGFSLPLPTATLIKLPRCYLAPLDMIYQGSIDERGRFVEKSRLAHELSLKGPSGMSVNSRVIGLFLPANLFWFALRHMVHFIVGCRLHFPEKLVLIDKADMKTAYRRVRLQLVVLVECIPQLDRLLFMMSRFPFRGKPCPAQWCTISEPICDLATELIHEAYWSPDSLRSCYDSVLPVPDRAHSDTPFTDALPLAFSIPKNAVGSVNCSICVDIDDNAERCASRVALALDVVGCPLALNDPLARDALISSKKLQGEGKQEENKIVLGWEMNSRTLAIALTEAKFEIWLNEIQVFLYKVYAPTPVLKSSMGRFENAMCIMPHMRHFMGRFRKVKDQCIEHNTPGAKLTHTICADFTLMQRLLRKARDGIDMNMLTRRAPRVWMRSDASEHGLGRMHVLQAVGWRWLIPDKW
jgi:hypothetical protein